MDEPPGNTATFFAAGQNMDVAVCVSVVLALALLWLVIITVEAAFFSLSANELNALSKRKKKLDVIVLWLMNYPNRLQITNLMLRWGIKVSVITLIVLLFHPDVTSTWVVLILGTIVSMTILTGEIFAKHFAHRYKVAIIRLAAPLWIVVILIATPFAFPLTVLQRLIVKVLGRRKQASERALTRVLQETLDEAGMNDKADASKHQLTFGSVTVKQVMKPASRLTAIEIGSDFNELLASITKSGYSRIPVYRTTPDKIEGVIYIKDLLPFMEQHAGFEWQKLLRRVYFVSETTGLATLLRDFQQKHIHMALVLDRMGRISGMITLHDLIEEVIGDINEQFNSVNPGT